jgi:hypothetical protein
MKAGKNVNVGIQAVIETIPLGINVGTGSSEQKMQQFCKIFHERSQHFEQRFSSSRPVNSASVSAWERCVALRAEGVEFRPQISSSFVMVEVRRTTGQPLQVNGILYDEALLSCMAPSENGALAPANATTVLRIQDDARWTVACQRKPQRAGDTVEFPKLDLGVVTNRGTLNVPVAQEARLPLQWSKQFESELALIRDQVNNVPKSLKVSCEDAAETKTGHYPSVTASIPTNKRSSHILVSGACSMNGYPNLAHNGTMLESRPTDSNTGWLCRAGDPPFQPLNITITASVKYCQITTAQ